MRSDQEEQDAMDALGALADFASADPSLESPDKLDGDFEALAQEGKDATLTGKTYMRNVPRQKEETLQKWVQCAKCSLWRKVPYWIQDEETPDEWTCADNKWDKAHASCAVPQALTDEQIDEILALQQGDFEEPEPEPEEEEDDDGYDDGDNDDEGDDVDGEGEDGEEGDGEDEYGNGGRPRSRRQKLRNALRRNGAGRNGGRSKAGMLPPRIPAGSARSGGSGSDGGRVPRKKLSSNGRGKWPPVGPDPVIVDPAVATAVPANSNAAGRQLPPMAGRAPSRPTSAGLDATAAGLRAARGRGRGGRGGAARGMGRGRIGHKLSEAAEALLGMGIELPEDEDMLDDEEGFEGDDGEAAPWPPGSFRPGRVVWAKVEGHDWWPARVVRRRAVPREVGPPPGGPTEVRTHIPVVFFTARGIPGEVNQGMDSVEGAMAACMRAMNSAGEGEAENEEAEFAWLPVDCLKPFSVGDGSGSGMGLLVEDSTLTACIAAAERALADMLSRHAASQPARDAEHEEEGEAEEHVVDLGGLSDSDGGWGVPVQQDVAVTPRARGRGRGGRGRRGRGRGGRRGRGRRGGYGRGGLGYDDEGSDSELVGEGEAALGGAPLTKIVVESIYGWRWPLSEKEKARERNKEKQRDVNSKRQQEHSRKSGHPSRATPSVEDSAVEAEAQAQAQPLHVARDHPIASQAEQGLPTANGNLPAAKAEDASEGADMGQEEADAVAALLAAASGLSEEGDTPAKEEPAQEERREPEYLVKWLGKAHVHNEWVQETLLLRIAKRKLINFKRRHGGLPCNFMDAAWQVPERLVARRPSPCGPGWEVLVKWTNLGFEQCTWELEGEGVLVHPTYLPLHRELWGRQQRALQRSRPEAIGAAAALREAGRASLADLQEQPEYVAGGQLHPHQLEAVNWLRRMWVEGKSALLADDLGLGKTATVISFIQCLRHEFQCPGPILIVMPASNLAFWEGEFAFWVGRDANVVSYSGSVAARSIIQENELWLTPASLDGKATVRKEGLPAKVVKPDVMLATYEAAVSDTPVLRSISWEVLIVDERNRQRSGLAKAHQALREVDTRHRLLLSHGALTQSPGELLQLLSFLRPQYQELADLPGDAEELPEEEQAAVMKPLIEPHMLRRARSSVAQPALPRREITLPVELAGEQAQCYRTVLARFYEMLADPKPPRHSGHRAAQMRTICAELRKVCNHPHLVQDFEAAGKEGCAAHVAASAKLQLLDRMLQRLQKAGRRVLLLSHMAKALDVLEDYAKERFGKDAVERIDHSTPAALRHAAVERFNAPDSPAFVFLLTTRSCGLGTYLPSIDTVIIHDSDWNPRWDIQAMLRAHCLGKGAALTVFRLYVRGSVEERILQLVEKKRGMDAVLKPGPGSRASAASARLLEDILRWGTTDLFHQQHATQAAPPTPTDQPKDTVMADASPGAQQPSTAGRSVAAYAAAAEERRASGATAGTSGEGQAQEGPVKMEGMEAAGGEAVAADRAADGAEPSGRGGDGKAEPGTPAEGPQRKATYSDAMLDRLLSRAEALQSTPSGAAADEPGKAGEPGGLVSQQSSEDYAVEAGIGSESLGPGLELVTVRDWDDEKHEVDEQDGGDEGDEEEKDEEAEPDEGEPVEDSLNRTESAASHAAYWDALLRKHWQRLQKEEEEALARSLREAQAEELEGTPGSGHVGLAGPEHSQQNSYGDDDDGDVDMLTHRTSSTMSNIMAEYAAEDAARTRRSTRGRQRNNGAGGGRGRASRRRRGEDADEETIVEEARAGKRRRRGEANKGGMSGPELEAIQMEWARQEACVRATNDPAKPEGIVFRRACERISEIGAELKLDASITELGHQAAQILLIMRDSTEAPSDFQDYTLVAIVAIAAQLLGASLGDNHGLPVLAKRYKTDLPALEQVFEYSMQILAGYRAMYGRTVQLLQDGVLDARMLKDLPTPASPSAPGHHMQDQNQRGLGIGIDHRQDDHRQAGAAGLSAADEAHAAQLAALSDMDAFGNRLHAIVSADFTHSALAAGPLEVPLGPLQALSAYLPTEPGPLAAETETIIKNLRTFQEQVALLDRVHSIRVKAIQEEYQKYMERVRGKAQGAIDTANSQYQHNRTLLTARVDALVHYLQQRHLQSQQHAQAGPASLGQQQAHQPGQAEAHQQAANAAAEQAQASALQQQQQQQQANHKAAASLAPTANAPFPAQNYTQYLASLPQEQQDQLTDQLKQHMQEQQQRLAQQEQRAAAEQSAAGGAALQMQPPSLPSGFGQQGQQAGQMLPPKLQQKGLSGSKSSGGSSAAGSVPRRSPPLAPKPPLAPPQHGKPSMPPPPQQGPSPRSGKPGSITSGQFGGPNLAFSMQQMAPASASGGQAGLLAGGGYHGAGYMQQQQQNQVLVRQLAGQPSGQLPLNRLTPQQSQQVLNMYQQRQLQDPRQPGMPVAGSSGQGSYPYQMQQAYQQQRLGEGGAQLQQAPGTASGPAALMQGVQQHKQKALAGSLAAQGPPSSLSSLVGSHGVTVQSGAPGFVSHSHPVKGADGLQRSMSGSVIEITTKAPSGHPGGGADAGAPASAFGDARAAAYGEEDDGSGSDTSARSRSPGADAQRPPQIQLQGFDSQQHPLANPRLVQTGSGELPASIPARYAADTYRPSQPMPALSVSLARPAVSLPPAAGAATGRSGSGGASDRSFDFARPGPVSTHAQPSSVLAAAQHSAQRSGSRSPQARPRSPIAAGCLLCYHKLAFCCCNVCLWTLAGATRMRVYTLGEVAALVNDDIPSLAEWNATNTDREVLRFFRKYWMPHVKEITIYSFDEYGHARDSDGDGGIVYDCCGVLSTGSGADPVYVFVGPANKVLTDILALPDEVLLHIAALLTTRDRLCVLPLVCKRWHMALTANGAAWRALHLDLKSMDTRKLAACIAWLGPRAAHVRSLGLHASYRSMAGSVLALVRHSISTVQIEGFLHPADVAALSTCSGLTSLKLHLGDLSTDVGEEEVARMDASLGLLSRLSGLRHLELYPWAGPEMLSGLSNLVCLTIAADDDVTLANLPAFHSLQRLDLSSSGDIELDITTLCAMTSLTSLDLSPKGQLVVLPGDADAGDMQNLQKQLSNACAGRAC
ncbi:hypothetical protein WJX72_001331 [[Myrmecia] bisecta]|uniref:Uncharacterized protein n=1 Tax=[Myrmecia] bisecta TaxID=41462 RepID=A0AAW1QQA6_9CHLO